MRLGRTLGLGIAVLSAMAAAIFGFLLAGGPGDDVATKGPLYEGTATLVQPAGRPAMVCGATEGNDPPACTNGLVVSGLEWASVTGHHRSGRDRWAVAHVVAHFDGRRLALADVSESDEAAPLEPAVHFGTSCDPPADGWRLSDDAPTGEAALNNLLRYAGSQPDLGRHWVDRGAFPGVGVHNFTFTGDLERHRLEMAALWGGPLCVAEGARARSSLQGLVDDLGDDAGLAPVPVVSVEVDEERGAVHVVGLIADPAFERWARSQLGDAPAVIEAVLNPVQEDSESARAH